MSKKISAIIQARITSTRLPGKILAKIEGKPMLWHLLNRLKFSRKLDQIILAIPDTEENDVLEKFAGQNNVECFRGDEEDVLSRYYQAAKKFECDKIVRIAADDPLVDPRVVDLVIKKHLESGADYTTNNLKRTFPLGLDTEIFDFKTLERAYKEAKSGPEREHVVIYIRQHPEIFHLVNVENNKDLSYLRCTVDEARDLEFVRQIYRKLYKEGRVFYMEEVINLVEQKPELLKINQGIRQKTTSFMTFMVKKNLNIQILVDKDSWIIPYANRLTALLNSKGHKGVLIFSQKKIKKGDILVILGWGSILSREILNLHQHNLVVHESALPRGKGWSPLTWQTLEGKGEVPITLFEAIERIDGGPIYFQDLMKFEGHELVDELRQQQGEKTIELVLRFVEGYPNIKGTKQQGKETFYKRREPKDSQIDPNKSIVQVFNNFRVADNEGYPAFFRHKGHKYILKICKEEENEKEK